MKPRSEQIRAARALLRWEQAQLAEASGISLSSIKRLEGQPGPLNANKPKIESLKRALEEAGIEFIPENGGGVGLPLKARQGQQSKSGE